MSGEASQSSRKAAQWHVGLRAYASQTGILLADSTLLFYLFAVSSYTGTRLATGTGSYFVLPWWVLLAAAVEFAIAWEVHGTSLAMKAGRVSLRPSHGDGALLFGQRVRRLLALQATVVLPLGVLSYGLVGTASAAVAAISGLVWGPDAVTAILDTRSSLLVLGVGAITFTLLLLVGSQPLLAHDRASGAVLSNDDRPFARKRWYRTGWGVVLTLLLVVTILAGSFITEIDLRALFTGASKTGIVWKWLLQPDWSLLSEGLGLLTVTLFMALMATLLAILFAAPLSFLAARNLMRGVAGRSIYTVLRGVMSTIRSIEPIVWAIIFGVWVRFGAFPGVLALFVHSIADLVKLYSERLESIDPGPVEAITAAGGNHAQVILYGIIPQIINPYLSFTLYRWDINVRMATIIGIVGGGGIGSPLYLATRMWRWQAAGMYMLLIVVAVWAIDYLSSRLRERLS